MAFAIVHFTVGFVVVLAELALVPMTRYRLAGGYICGIWALGPDIHHVIDDPLSTQIYAIHGDSLANVFFFHHYLDSDLFRSYNPEFTFISLASLGVAFVIHDWRFGAGPSSSSKFEGIDAVDESP